MFRLTRRCFSKTKHPAAKFISRIQTKLKENPHKLVVSSTNCKLVRCMDSDGTSILDASVDIAKLAENYGPFQDLRMYDVPKTENDRLSNTTMNHNPCGFGLSAFADWQIGARVHGNWYELKAGTKVPQGLGIIQDQEVRSPGHRLIVNTEEMSVEDFQTQLKEFEEQDWRLALEVPRIPEALLKESERKTSERASPFLTFSAQII